MDSSEIFGEFSEHLFYILILFQKLYLFPPYMYTRAGITVDSTVHCFRIRDDNFYCLHLAYPTQKQCGVVALCRTGLRKAGVACPPSCSENIGQMLASSAGQPVQALLQLCFACFPLPDNAAASILYTTTFSVLCF